ncbi:MAG: HAD family hydrolase [Gammaproteobacteria bacterium]|nr:HAD family hydrolase [Gammaproteobacteria bacterium]
MAQLEAILFDVDGTLAETERDGHRVAFNMAFAAEGLDWEWSESLYGKLLAVTGGKERIRRYIDQYLNDFHYDGDLDEMIKALHLSKNGYYAQLVEQGKISLRPGVERLINEARAQNIRLAIATTTSMENVTNLLTGTLGKESIEWFELIAAGDIVPAKKPAPDIYFYTLEKMQLAAENCIAIEDSSNGIRSSRAADLTTLITPSIYTMDDDFSEAALIVETLDSGDVTVDTLRQLLDN